MNILAYYDRIDPELADRVEQSIDPAPQLLIDFPFAGPETGSGVRKWPVRGLPLYLLYKVGADWIEVSRIVHESQNWRRA